MRKSDKCLMGKMKVKNVFYVDLTCHKVDNEKKWKVVKSTGLILHLLNSE